MAGVIPLQFQPGEVAKMVKVSTINDTCEESTESFFLDLKNPTGPAMIGRGTRRARGRVWTRSIIGSAFLSQIELNNVMIGDVRVCSGQSNMAIVDDEKKWTVPVTRRRRRTR